jgi:two-component system cell cycle sensor histidine kinase/response regulator CckA
MPDPQSMARLARMAGGIAPALSDLLTVIRGQTEVLLNQAEHAAGAPEALKQIYTAAEKAGSLLRQLLIFSGQQAPHPGPVALNGLVEETAGVLHRLLGATITAEFRLTPELPGILADPGMLEQVLIILAVNAREAMPGGGRLLVRTAVAEVPAGVGQNRTDGPPRKFVVLSVEDTGRGIPPEILPRIFEPFFTTKAGGRSLGLGLATVFGIAQQHHGWVTAENLAGAGARFTVFLPVARPGQEAAAGRATPARPARGHETILLVDDEASVREFTAQLLSEQGYRVLQAGTGPAALEAWQWHGPRVRLLLTDMVLEGHMSGLQLAARLRAENPGLKVICTSGHQRDTMERFPELSGGYHFLPKPCRPQTLLAAVRTLLDEKLP